MVSVPSGLRPEPGSVIEAECGLLELDFLDTGYVQVEGLAPGASCPFPSGQQTSLSWHLHQILGSRASSSPGWESSQS